MLPKNQFNKVSIVCKCGAEDCLGKKTGMMVLFFGRTDEEWDVADEVEELLKERGIWLRDIETGAKAAINAGEFIEVTLDVLEAGPVELFK